MHAAQLWDIMECQGCMQQYNSDDRVPRLLMCGHTFCSTCCQYLLETTRAVKCPIDKKIDIRYPVHIPPSLHLMRLIERVEVGCYWHYSACAAWYCPENLVSACHDCKAQYQDWGWESLCDPNHLVDLPGLLTQGILKMLEDQELKELAYSSNPDIRERRKNLLVATARERQILYFFLLSYRDKQEYLIPSPPKQPAFSHCIEDDHSLLILRFRNTLPSIYTPDCSRMHTWRVDTSPKQVEAVTFRISRQAFLYGVLLGEECLSRDDNGVQFIALVSDDCTDSSQAQELNLRSREPFKVRGAEKFTFQPVIVQPDLPYTIKVKFYGKGVRYGDPLTCSNFIRGPRGFEIRFLQSRYILPDVENGFNCRSGPILALYFHPTGDNGQLPSS